MPEPFRVVGFARREKTDASWREEMKAGIERFSRSPKVDAAQWDAFAENLFYHRGDLTDAKAYASLGTRLADFENEQLANNLIF